uniref:Uncharacterized protein n=1 Tax=Phocoena sinus TaxID=42100 RepID=A0A8C9E428_PHOSS
MARPSSSHSHSHCSGKEQPDTKRGSVCQVGWGIAMSNDDSRECQLLLIFVFQPANREETNITRRRRVKSDEKNSKLFSTSTKKIQKKQADITLDPPPNCRTPTEFSWG